MLEKAKEQKVMEGSEDDKDATRMTICVYDAGPALVASCFFRLQGLRAERPQVPKEVGMTDAS